MDIGPPGAAGLEGVFLRDFVAEVDGGAAVEARVGLLVVEGGAVGVGGWAAGVGRGAEGGGFGDQGGEEGFGVHGLG